MARPVKEGLEYFPLDCDMDQDDKIMLVEAQHGIQGFGIAVKLLMKIYKNGYFYEWTEKEQLLFSKRINVDINCINDCINDLVKWNFFNKNLFDNDKILTSVGIQRRYLEAVSRRQKVKMLRKYMLLDRDSINAYKNLIIVDTNTSTSVVNENISTQSKEKNNKEKNNKENNNTASSSLEECCCSSDNDFNIFSYLEQRGFIGLSAIVIQQIQADMDLYSVSEVKKAIDIADDNGKHSYAYVRGILERRRAGINEKTKKDSDFEKVMREAKEAIEKGEDPF